MRYAGLLASFLIISACTAEHRAALEYANEQAKAFKDTEAAIFLKAPCAMSVGAYWRLTEAQRNHVDGLCGK